MEKDEEKIEDEKIEIIAEEIDEAIGEISSPFVSSDSIDSDVERDGTVNEKPEDDIITQIEDELNNMNDSDIADDIKVTEMARIIVRRYFRESQRKRPLTSVHLIRVDDSNF